MAGGASWAHVVTSEPQGSAAAGAATHSTVLLLGPGADPVLWEAAGRALLIPKPKPSGINHQEHHLLAYKREIHFHRSSCEEEMKVFACWKKMPPQKPPRTILCTPCSPQRPMAHTAPAQACSNLISLR